MAENKYLNLEGLSNFLGRLQDTFAMKSHEHSWNELNDKPFNYEAGSTIEFSLSSSYFYLGNMTYYQGTGKTYSANEIIGATMYIEDANGNKCDGYANWDGRVITEADIFEYDWGFTVGYNANDIKLMFVNDVNIVIGSKTATAPSVGVYTFCDVSNIDAHVSRLEIPEVVKTLDEQFIPDTIARTDHTHSWDELEDKPFYNDRQLYCTMADNVAITLSQNSETTVGGSLSPFNNPFGTNFGNSRVMVAVGDEYKWVDVEYIITINGIIYTATKTEGEAYSISAWYGDNKDEEVRIGSSQTDSGRFEVHNINYNGEEFVVNLDVYIQNLKTLDEQFIPDTIARTTDVDAALATKADASHTHDDIYYTETEIDAKFDSITSGDMVVAEAEHAVAADTSTKAEQDASGNIITETYETKVDASAKLTEAKAYADTQIAALVNSAPETLDTLGELATAFQENEEVVTALDAAITTKADKIHTHVWNDLEDKPFGTTLDEVLFIEFEEAYLDGALGVASDCEIKSGDPVRVRMTRNSEEVVIDITWLGESGIFYEETASDGTYFGFIVSEPYNNATNIRWLCDDMRPDPYTPMRIYALSEAITTLEEQYIPDTIATKTYVDEVKTYVDESMTTKADVDHVHSWNDLEDKPFYESTEVKRTALLPETEFVFYDDDDSDGYVSAVTAQYVLQTNGVEIGETVELVFDGHAVTYTVPDYVQLGNAEVEGGMAYVEDSAVFMVNDSFGVESGTTHLVAMNKIDFVNVTTYLDEKYLRPFDKNIEVIVEETAVEGEAEVPIGGLLNFEVEEGVFYVIEWDNVRYECEAYAIDGLVAFGNGTMARLSGGGNFEPFAVLYVDGNTLLVPETSGTHTFSILKLNIEINESCIPDTIATKIYVDESIATIQAISNDTIDALFESISA